MNKTKLRWCDQYREQVKRNARVNLASHTVVAKHREGDECRRWCCSQNGSSKYAFTVLAVPGWLIMFGDMGECMWSRTYDMIDFARNAIRDIRYFSEKVSRDVCIRDGKSELVLEWIKETPEEWEQCYGEPMSKKNKSKFAELCKWWTQNGCDQGIEEFRREIYESGLYEYDCEAIPSFQFYKYHYLWKVEALVWFIEQLDGIKTEVEA